MWRDEINPILQQWDPQLTQCIGVQMGLSLEKLEQHIIDLQIRFTHQTTPSGF